MAKTDFVPSKTTRTDVQIGVVVADQRTGDLQRVIYADSQIVLIRDQTDRQHCYPARRSRGGLGTRYRARPEADLHIDGGQYERLRARLAEYDEQDGRKARHKADALREAVDLLAGTTADETERDTDEEVAFEEIPGSARKRPVTFGVRGS